MGFRLTRRQFLAKSALVAATFPVASVARPGWSLAQQAVPGVPVPLFLELVTVTDTSAIITWFTGDPTQPDEFGRPAPVAAPGRVLIGTDPTNLVEVGAHGPTPYHYVEVTGLRPGTRYLFVAESNGIPALPTTLDPVDLHPLYVDAHPGGQPLGIDTSNAGVFTTLTPPPGEEVLRMAWFNDMHFGERISGILFNGFPPGFPADPANPYWRFMGNAAVDEAVQRGCELLLVNGDLTNEAEPDALAEIKATLDRFGTYAGGRRDAAGDFVVSKGQLPAYWVTRGNHDRAHAGELYEGATPVAGNPEFLDTFYDTFRDGWAPGSRTSKFSVVVDSGSARWRLVCLDSNDLTTGSGVLSREQLDYLEDRLSAATEPSFVLLHHPAGFENNLLGLPPLAAGVEVETAGAFRQVLAAHGESVIGVYQGHTHRNNHTRSPETGDLPFYEGGATKEYPGGYTVVRLFEGGYMVNFYKTSDPEARAWSERSRGEFLGLYPYYTLGSLGDRNWTYEVDLRRRTTPESPPTSEAPEDPVAEPGAPETSPGGTGTLPATGRGDLLGLGAAAAGTAALASWIRRQTEPR